MTRILRVDISLFRWSRLLLALMALTLIPGCGKRESAPATEAATQPPSTPSYLTRQAMLAIEFVESTVGGMQDGGGFQAWTAEKVAVQIVPVLNAVIAPEPGEARTPGPKFKYVANQVTGPWQVSIEVVGESLLVKAYGADVDQPLAQKTIPVGRY